jgi:hypothetical protein
MKRETRPLLLSLLPALLLLARQAPAAAAPQWITGDSISAGFCDNAPGSTRSDHGPPTVFKLQALGEPDGSFPRVGDLYYLRVLITVPRCPEFQVGSVGLMVSLPKDALFHITDEHPIECYVQGEGEPEPRRLPEDECATRQPLRHMIDAITFDRPSWTFEPAKRTSRPVTPGAVHIISLPVVSTRPLPPGELASTFVAALHRSPFTHIESFVSVVAAPRAMEITDLVTSDVTSHSVKVTARFFSLFRTAIGEFVFEGGGSRQSGPPIPFWDNNIYGTYSNAPDNLKPNTEYRWWAVLNTPNEMAQSAVQTFRTPDGPAGSSEWPWPSGMSMGTPPPGMAPPGAGPPGAAPPQGSVPGMAPAAGADALGGACAVGSLHPRPGRGPGLASFLVAVLVLVGRRRRRQPAVGAGPAVEARVPS